MSNLGPKTPHARKGRPVSMWTPERIAQLRELRAARRGFGFIARAFGISENAAKVAGQRFVTMTRKTAR